MYQHRRVGDSLPSTAQLLSSAKHEPLQLLVGADVRA